MGKRILYDSVWVAIIAAVYYLVARMSTSLLFEPENIAAIWPAAGVYLSAILLTKKSLRPYLICALFLTDLVVELQAGSSVVVGFIYAFAGTLGASLSAWLLIRFAGEKPAFNKIKQVLLFILISIIFCNAVAASIAAIGPWLLLETPYWHSWSWWWSSDAVGNLLLTPFILSWASVNRSEVRKIKPGSILELIVLLVSMTIVSYVALTKIKEHDELFTYLNLLTFPFLIWAAMRFRVRGVTAASVLITVSLLYFIKNGQITIYTSGSDLNVLIVVQLYLAIISVSSLILASLVSERREAVEILRESELKLRLKNEELNESNNFIRTVLDNLPIGVSLNTIDKGEATYTNKKFEEIYGWSLNEINSVSSFFESVYPDEEYRKHIVSRIMADINTGDPEKMHWENVFVTRKDGSVRIVNAANIPLVNQNTMVSTVIDITELHQIQKDLILAKEKAEESDRLKTAFLQNLSHEIRTPMNAIMGFASLLVENYNNREILEQYSEIIGLRCADLLKIINDILYIARIESGMLSINKEECNLTRFFAELTAFFTEYQRRTDKEHISLNLHSYCGKDEETIITDKIKLEQIFINLIDNAFKFTNKGTVEGGCRFDANHKLIFYVTDTGIGIPKDKHDEIFNRFTQLKHEKDFNYGGTGLGLSIVKGLIGLIGGDISVESEPGKGTTFCFSIDYQKSQSVSHENTFIDDTRKYHFPGKTILVVEDDRYNAEYIKIILSNAGLKVLHTESGSEAVHIAATQSPDLVLMDIRLPDISGYEATRQIKQQKPGLKVIAQTAYAAQEDKQKAFNAGCIDYISKPLKQSLLLFMIDKHLKKILI